MLANRRRDPKNAEYTLNSDAGGGDFDKNGKAITYLMQVVKSLC